jgi:hypothetical protein
MLFGSVCLKMNGGVLKKETNQVIAVPLQVFNRVQLDGFLNSRNLHRDSRNPK